MTKKKIALLFGGCSSEYEVSLQSAAAVMQHIDTERYELFPLGITRSGEWFLYDGSPANIADDSWSADPGLIRAVISPDRQTRGIVAFSQKSTMTIRLDAAFPLLHGKNGEDGTVQGLLELAGIPIIGCTTLASALCMDKDMAHKLVEAAGIQIPASFVIRNDSRFEENMQQAASLSYPLFVKPARAGSSFGITKVMQEDALREAVLNAFEYDQKVIVEQAVDGFEVGCAIMGTESLVVGEVDEVELSRGFFDYTEKYTLQSSKIHMPARLDKADAQRVKDAAVTVYRALECSGLARVDFFFTPAGDIVFNEVNTIPGFTAHSRFPTMMKGIGLSFGEILDHLIGTAVTP